MEATHQGNGKSATLYIRNSLGELMMRMRDCISYKNERSFVKYSEYGPLDQNQVE